MKGKGTNCICIQFFRNFHVANYDKNCIKCYNTSTVQQKKRKKTTRFGKEKKDFNPGAINLFFFHKIF